MAEQNEYLRKTLEQHRDAAKKPAGADSAVGVYKEQWDKFSGAGIDSMSDDVRDNGFFKLSSEGQGWLMSLLEGLKVDSQSDTAEVADEGFVAEDETIENTLIDSFVEADDTSIIKEASGYGGPFEESLKKQGKTIKEYLGQLENEDSEAVNLLRGWMDQRFSGGGANPEKITGGGTTY